MSALDPGQAALLTLLICGHFLGDFVFQTAWMVREKARSRAALGAHVAEMWVVHALCILPVFHHPIGLVFAGLLALLHGAIDLIKGFTRPRWGWLAFLVDQLFHLVAVWLVYRLWITRFEGTPPSSFSGTELETITKIAAFVGIAAFNVNGASALVTTMLAMIGADASEPAGSRPAEAGRVIGILERLLVLTAVTLGEWGAVGLVLAAKSIARFKQLDDRDFAEKYLVGTMGSVLIAVGSGLLCSALLG